MASYVRYGQKTVILKDVLEFLDEKVDSLSRSVFRYTGEEPAERLAILVGRVSGLEAAITQLEYHFGDKLNSLPPK